MHAQLRTLTLCCSVGRWLMQSLRYCCHRLHHLLAHVCMSLLMPIFVLSSVSINETCWSKCMTKFAQPDLTIGELSCDDRCVLKYLATQVNATYSQTQQYSSQLGAHPHVHAVQCSLLQSRAHVARTMLQHDSHSRLHSALSAVLLLLRRIMSVKCCRNNCRLAQVRWVRPWDSRDSNMHCCYASPVCTLSLLSTATIVHIYHSPAHPVHNCLICAL